MSETKTVKLPVIPKEVAEDIERARSYGYTDLGVILLINDEDEEFPDMWRYSSVNPQALVEAIVNGYTVEKTPEEKVREYYERLDKRPYCSDNHGWHKAMAVEETLDLLGIEIEGVND